MDLVCYDVVLDPFVNERYLDHVRTRSIRAADNPGLNYNLAYQDTAYLVVQEADRDHH